jgi:nucleotide-binding universal stress UspA family protein
MKKILVPTDFSNNSKQALQVAAALAARFNAQLEILHTNTAIAYAPVLPEYGGATQYELDDYYEMATSELYNLKTELTSQPGYNNLRIETRIEEGFLHSSIRRVCEDDQVDLVVMGTKGATGAVEFFVGSNTEKVIRTAICPVLAIPESNHSDFNVKKVVLATTLKADQAIAFKTLAAWQQVFPFEVQVLYLNNPAGFDTNEQIETVAAQMATQWGLKHVSAHVSSNTFNEESSILQFAREQEASMIVMATHQRQGLSHLLFGSLTEDTVNHSDMPVLSIPIR